MTQQRAAAWEVTLGVASKAKSRIAVVWRLRCLAVALVCVRLGDPVASADEPPPFAEPRDDTELYQVDVLRGDLNAPACVTVRPGWSTGGPFEVYVSEAGAGRVVRLSTDQGDADSLVVISGFPVAQLDGVDGLSAGPLGLAFLSRNRLLVGTGGVADGADVVNVYNLVDDDQMIDFSATHGSAGPVEASPRSVAGEHGFWNLALTDDALLVAPLVGDEQGWVLKAHVEANRLLRLTPFISMREAADVPTATALTIDPRPQHHYLVVGHAGEASDERDSRLTMYDPDGGALALSLATGLRDIVALAYSPGGDLYAADAAWASPADGGVYRLEAAQVEGRQSVRPVKIASVIRPTSVAITPNGTMLVTALGEPTADDAASTGQLLRVIPKGGTPDL